jgi:hypothetical protein
MTPKKAVRATPRCEPGFSPAIWKMSVETSWRLCGDVGGRPRCQPVAQLLEDGEDDGFRSLQIRSQHLGDVLHKAALGCGDRPALLAV